MLKTNRRPITYLCTLTINSTVVLISYDIPVEKNETERAECAEKRLDPFLCLVFSLSCLVGRSDCRWVVIVVGVVVLLVVGNRTKTRSTMFYSSIGRCKGNLLFRRFRALFDCCGLLN